MGLIRKTYSFLIDILQSLLIAGAVFLVVYQFLLRPFEVKGDSMYPNFHNNSYVLTNIVGLRFENPRRGDVIVFKSPPDPEKAFIKRVIGTPGDKILIQNGKIYINEMPLNEPYLENSVKTAGGTFVKEGIGIKVPQDEYIVMGDNRNFSSDSREWGLVAKNMIIGYSMFVYWPVNDAKLVKNPFTP